MLEPEALVTLEAVQKGLDWELSDEEKGIAENAIEELSDDARYYGLSGWVDPDRTPRPVLSLVRRAVVAYMKNYEGFTQSRAGDETLVWDGQGENAGRPYFTSEEQKRLRSYRQKGGGLSTVSVVAYGNRRSTAVGLVPVSDGTRPFPLFASSDGPW